MIDLLNNDLVGFEIEKNPLIARAQAVASIPTLQLFDVTLPSRFQSRNLAHNLGRESLWYRTQIIQRLLSVFNHHSSQLVP